MTHAPRTPDALTLGMFALAVTLGGANFLAVRFSNLELAPFWGAGLRFALAGTLFVLIAASLRLPLPRGATLWRTVLYGLFSFTLFYALMYWALLQVTAGVATIVMAIVPLVTILLAAAQRLERLRARSVLGALVALAGIAWMTLAPDRTAIPPGALLAMVGAAASVGQGIIVAKRLASSHPAMTNAVGMSVGALLLLLLSALVGEPWDVPVQGDVVIALAYLVTLGSVGLFALGLFVVGRWTASATSYMFVLFPVATLVLEAAITGEAVSSRALIGAAVVMSGVWFGAFARRATPEPPAAVGTA